MLLEITRTKHFSNQEMRRFVSIKVKGYPVEKGITLFKCMVTKKTRQSIQQAMSRNLYVSTFYMLELGSVEPILVDNSGTTKKIV